MGMLASMPGLIASGSKALYGGAVSAGKSALSYLSTPEGAAAATEVGKGAAQLGTSILVARKRRTESRKLEKEQEKIITRQETVLKAEKKEALDKLKYQRMSRSNFREYL